MAHPYTTAAGLLVDQIAQCLLDAGLTVPTNVGVVFCAPCIIPGCCDHLVAELRPALDAGCIADNWTVPVTYGICYTPVCSSGPPAAEWLAAQVLLAGQIEDALNAILACAGCATCNPPISVTKFCEGGCAGFVLTYKLSPVM